MFLLLIQAYVEPLSRLYLAYILRFSKHNYVKVTLVLIILTPHAQRKTIGLVCAEPAGTILCFTLVFTIVL